MKNIKSGDLIRVNLKNKIIEGILMPTLSKKAIFVKLKSGYNIGIDKNKIRKINLIKKFIKTKKRKVDVLLLVLELII